MGARESRVTVKLLKTAAVGLDRVCISSVTVGLGENQYLPPPPHPAPSCVSFTSRTLKRPVSVISERNMLYDYSTCMNHS